MWIVPDGRLAAYLQLNFRMARNSFVDRVGHPVSQTCFRSAAILALEEVAKLIDNARSPFYRTILLTLCATRMRRCKLTHLKISDIDSQRMLIHVEGGNGRDDRHAARRVAPTGAG